LSEWNGKRAIVSDDFLEDFRILLIDRKIKEIKENNNYNNSRNRAVNNNVIKYLTMDGLKNYYNHQYTIL
jgi:hypothetical protein